MNHVYFESESDFVRASISESETIIRTFAGREDEPASLGYAKYGIPYGSSVCQDQKRLQDIEAYRAIVENTNCSAWMDNTTIMTACRLMSENGAEVMTPLTVWDLVTFINAVVCYEHIYHHEHPAVDDVEINKLLGGNMLKSVPVPFQEPGENRYLPKDEDWNGAYRFMCHVWQESYYWLERLYRSVGTRSLDGQQIEAVTNAWRKALGKDDLKPEDLVDYKGVNNRWRSPSNGLLSQIVDFTSLEDTQIYLDPDEKFKEFFSSKERKKVLSDLNLRSHINQRIAEFFELPYACSAARLPFRKYLYDRGLKIHQELTTAKVIDERYGELSGGVHLRLPVFLAVALREAKTPTDLWSAIAKLRQGATKFRTYRAELDEELARGDKRKAEEMAKALSTSMDSLLEITSRVTANATASVKLVWSLSQGDLLTATNDISAVVAAGKGLLETSFVERLMWRLRKPQLLWINDVVEQSTHLTEALDGFSRVWQIPLNRQEVFLERFKSMTGLAS